MNDSDTAAKREDSLEAKQNFLAAAISDISSYIQFSDAKVSIVMGATVALMAGLMACSDQIAKCAEGIDPCSWRGMALIVFTAVAMVSLLCVFVFGIKTVKNHAPSVNYPSKWFIRQSCSEYSLENYLSDVAKMSADDVIENMGAELYKLNEINRQKSSSADQTIKSFEALLLFSFLILLVVLGGMI